jgi:GT2 family glycosyltransferase
MNSAESQLSPSSLKRTSVSVIVPFYNAREDIVECVESILNQDLREKSCEIILVDNASSDDGRALLEQFKDRITVITEKRKGHGFARNRGLSCARGEIIAFMDSDCVASQDWLEQLVDSLKRSGSAAVAGEIKAFRPHTDVEAFYEGLMSQKKNLSYDHPYAVTANLAVSRSVFKDVAFDNMFSQTEDVDFCWRLQERGFRISYQPGALVYHKNIKTRGQLFKKVFQQGFYAPKVIKKNLAYLEREKKLPRVNPKSYIFLIRDCILLLFSGKGQRGKRDLEVVFRLARKLGLICGSIRFGFLYI